MELYCKIRLFTICLHYLLPVYFCRKPFQWKAWVGGNCSSERVPALRSKAYGLQNGYAAPGGIPSWLIDYKIEVHTGNMPFLIFRVIPHISSAICNLTGFCNGCGVTWLTFQIKGNTQLLISGKFFLQQSAGFFLSWSWYTLRVLSSFLPWWIQKTPESWYRKKRETKASFHLLGMETSSAADMLPDKSTLFLEKTRCLC